MQTEFNNNIAQLLTTFPPDSLTTAGTPFWSVSFAVEFLLSIDVFDFADALRCCCLGQRLKCFAFSVIAIRLVALRLPAFFLALVSHTLSFYAVFRHW